jgi:hypothetical protein
MDRNKIFEAIAKSSIDPAECRLSGIGGAKMIVHESGSKFTFNESEEGGFWAIATVEDGSEKVTEGPGIDDVLDAIPEWADEIKQVAETPDYWAQMRRNRQLITDIQQRDSGNTPFTQDEQGQITTLLNEVAHALTANSELTSEQLERIEERLDEAAEASTRMGRKDWFFLSSRDNHCLDNHRNSPGRDWRAHLHYDYSRYRTSVHRRRRTAAGTATNTSLTGRLILWELIMTIGLPNPDGDPTTIRAEILDVLAQIRSYRAAELAGDVEKMIHDVAMNPDISGRGIGKIKSELPACRGKFYRMSVMLALMWLSLLPLLFMVHRYLGAHVAPRTVREGLTTPSF